MPQPDRVLTDTGPTRAPATGSIDGVDEQGRVTGTIAFLSGGGEMVLHVAFTPDQRWLLAGRFRGQLDFWDTRTWSKVRSIDTGHDRVTALATSSDGKYAATGGDDLFVKVWDIARGARVTKIGGCKDYPTALRFSPDGQLIIVIVNGGPDFVYDLSTRRKVKELKANDAAFFRSGTTAITALAEELSLWDVKKWEVQSRVPDPAGWMHNLVLDEARNRVATGSVEEGTKLWDLTTKRPLLHVPSGYAGSLALSPDGRWLLTAGDGFIRFWSVESGEEMCTSADIGLWEIVLSPEARWLAAGVDDTIQVWDFDKLVRSCPGQRGPTASP